MLYGFGIAPIERHSVFLANTLIVPYFSQAHRFHQAAPFDVIRNLYITGIRITSRPVLKRYELTRHYTAVL